MTRIYLMALFTAATILSPVKGAQAESHTFSCNGTIIDPELGVHGVAERGNFTITTLSDNRSCDALFHDDYDTVPAYSCTWDAEIYHFVIVWGKVRCTFDPTGKTLDCGKDFPCTLKSE